MENYYTYIIESLTSFRWYFGHTNDIERRLTEHNSGQNKATKNKGPWKLIFLKQFDGKLEANRFEIKLKKLRNKKYIRNEYSEYFLDVSYSGHSAARLSRPD
ncbi:MAG: hypothetical protein AUK34_09955 [Ignavibacteria bacterium CG2_30_36_16]|nr:MAG: hypothetical protein AUK34_09955 [Ignavibacteria bacterium CG2_30_36_16]